MADARQIYLVQRTSRPEPMLPIHFRAKRIPYKIYSSEEVAFREAQSEQNIIVLYEVEKLSPSTLSWVKKFRNDGQCRVMLITSERPNGVRELYEAGAEVVFYSPVICFLVEEAIRCFDIHYAKETSRHPRIKIEVPVQLHFESVGMFSKTENLSFGGMFVHFNDLNSLPPERVRFELFLPSEKLVSIQGEAVIRWRRDDIRKGFGAEFLNIPEAAKDQLATFVNESRTH